MKITKVGKLRYSSPFHLSVVSRVSQSNFGIPPYVQNTPVSFIDLSLTGIPSKLGDTIDFTQTFLTG